MPNLRNELVYLWSIFVSLRNASEGVISYNQIRSYCEIYGNLNVFEVDLITELDRLYRKEAHNG